MPDATTSATFDASAVTRATFDASTIKAVAFDAYGTLFNFANADFHRAVSVILAEQGIETDLDAFFEKWVGSYGEAAVWSEMRKTNGGGGAGSDPLDAGGGGGGGGGASYVTPSGTNTTITWGSGQPSVTLTYTPTQPVVVVPPQVQGVSPTSGTTAGGYTVTISGIYFGSARQVYFGNVAAPQFTVQGFNTITAVVPASQIAGTFDVRVVGPGGLMSPIAQPADQFTYTVVPAPAPAPTPTPTPTPAPPTPSTSTICRVPNVIGTTLSQARSLLRTAHCSLGTVEGTTSRGNRVARQTIPAGTRLVPGDKVGLRMRAIKRGKH